MEKNQNNVPEYAKVLGKGKFAAIGDGLWYCTKCGRTYSGRKPLPTMGGSCTSGLHNWRKQ